MSPMIPHCRDIELQIDFQKLSVGTILPQYLRSAGALERIAITSLAADLHLWWYVPPLNYQLPRQISLQTWHLREFVQDVGLVQNNVESASVQTDLITLENVPSLIVIHAEVNKDSANYTNIAMCIDDNQAGNNAATSPNNNALDSFMEIRHLEVDIGSVSQVIGIQFTQQELYNLTKKNSKMLDFPWDYYTWKGAHMKAPTPAATRYNQMSRCFIALRPKDLSEKLSDGIRTSFQLQFTMGLIARDGLNGIPGGDKDYKLYVHTFFGKHYMPISSEGADYRKEIVNVNTVLQKPMGSNIKIDDSRYQSRASQI
ncbi:MAG: hypothetical protein GY756_13895 [bacterium]|nr:hypothetical protein [bacterium]